MKGEEEDKLKGKGKEEEEDREEGARAFLMEKSCCVGDEGGGEKYLEGWM